MNARVVSSSLLLVLGIAVTARADPYTILPDGSVVFNAAFTTQGTFTCRSVVPCSGSGTNTVTLGSGSSAVTISFAGVSSTAVVGNVTVPVSLGTFTSVSADPAFPSNPNPNTPVVQFNLSMSQSSPAVGAQSLFMTFGPGGSTTLPVLEAPRNYLSFPTGPNPPGYSYTSVVYSLSVFPSIRANGATPLEAQAGVVPEPATLALMASGLGLIAAARRRRRRSPSLP